MTKETLTEGMDAKEIAKLMKKAGCTDKQIQAVTGLTPSGLKAVLNEKIAFEDLESFLENWRHQNPSSLRAQASAAMARRGVKVNVNMKEAPSDKNHTDTISHLEKKHGVHVQFGRVSTGNYSTHMSHRSAKDLHASLTKDGWKYDGKRGYTKGKHEVRITKKDYGSGVHVALQTKK